MVKIRIDGIEEMSIAEELNIQEGSYLISINNHQIVDRFDYLFFSSEEYVELEIMDENEEIVIYEIEKDIDEEIGLVFEDPLMDCAKHCSNACVFCFIDQLPKGLRKPLYFKDDDSRLSFIQGNFVTLTNMTNLDLQRIVDMGIFPINVSVHSTDPEIRLRMLKNPKSKLINEQLQFLADRKVQMNAQIVLVPGYNDGKNYQKTLEDLLSYHPWMNSVAVVPLGMTKYRERLEELKAVDAGIAREIIDLTHAFQEKAMKTIGSRFAFLADEFYLLANEKIPDPQEYEGYLHYENGVGMIRKFIENFEAQERPENKKRIHLVTAVSFAGVLEELKKKHEPFFKNITIQAVKNQFLGESINVAGLLSYEDTVKSFKNLRPERIVLPNVMFNHDGYTLDQKKREDFERELACPVDVIEANAASLIEYVEVVNG